MGGVGPLDRPDPQEHPEGRIDPMDRSAPMEEEATLKIRLENLEGIG